MKIKWLGHACFLITSDKGTRIITDPFKVEGMTYKEVTQEADIVTSSHAHNDHSNTDRVKGSPLIIRGKVDKTVKDVKIRAVPTYHDDKEGRERGPNLAFCFEVDGINICHMGDLGHLLEKQEIDSIGKVDVLLVPVGGVFTLEAGQAVQLCGMLKPAIAIPMHYKTEHCTWLKCTADDFVSGYDNYRKLSTDEIELAKSNLPQPTEFIIPGYKG
jgi:L-ascorbate metabolism protein UlaG (beta-lactamase superfamily)